MSPKQFSISRRATVVGILTLGALALVLIMCGLAANISPAMANDRIRSVFTVCPAGPPTCDFNIIQDAVDAAAWGDIIKVAAGTYTHINNYDGLAQILYLEKSVTVRGGYTTSFTDPPDPIANPTILDAQGGGRIVFMSNEGAAPVLEGLVMTHGDATGLGGTPYGDDAGGGLYLWGGATVISDCVITGNYAPQDGGGIYMRMFSQAQLIRNEISENQGTFGAGIYVWYSYPLVVGNLIAENTATYAGGGVWLGVYSSATFEQNMFLGNVGYLSSNEGAGGMLGERCTLQLDGNIFHENSTVGGGSGLTLIRCDATLTNNMFADNWVNGVGSSLYLTGANAQLYHNTFSGTSGGTSSGIYLDTHWEPRYSQANLVNTIIVSETIGIYAASGNSAALEATLWGYGAWANDDDWSGAGDIVTGTINLWGNPAFVSPSSGNYHIAASSPAVDAGIDAGVQTDIDGQARPNGLGMDIGADEYYASNLLVTTLEDELNDDGDCSLREALEAANTNTEVDACRSGGMLNDTITFAVQGTITANSQLEVAAGGPLVIDGGDVITTSGGGTTRVWWIEVGSEVTLQSLTVMNGYAERDGGGLYNNNGNVTITDSTFSANSVGAGGDAGGIYNAGNLMISNSTFFGNEAWRKGGGIYNSNTVTIVNTTFSGNIARQGGGIANEGALAINNSTFSGNGASTHGGGIWGKATLHNTIIANNLSGGDCYSSITDSGHNLDSDGTCDLDPGNGSLPGTDPLLGPLQDNGGSTWTYALFDGSPAIDAGDEAQCPPTDQRGFVRPMDGDGFGNPICDIGAYEHATVGPWLIHLIPPSQSQDGPQGATLTYVIALNNHTNLTDTYNLALGPHTWEAYLSPETIGPLSPDDSQTFTLTVAIPQEAPWYLSDTVVITATSNANPANILATAQVTSRAYAPPQISVDPLSLESTQYAGETITQLLTISNGNGVTLTFDIRGGDSLEGSILLLHLDEPAGSTNFYDSSGNNYHGTCIDDYCPIAGVPGRSGSGVLFDGINDYIEHPELINGLSEGTISLWFKVHSWNPGSNGLFFWAGVVALPNSGSSWDGLNLGAHPGYVGNHILFGIYEWDWIWANSGLIPNLEDWYHLVGTWGEEGIKIYVNGILMGTNSYTSSAPNWINYNVIGSSSWPGTFIDGVIDEVSIYPHALTAEEIESLFYSWVDTSWLTVEPVSGTISTNTTQEIVVSFDATVLQPDIYTTTLSVSSNDPLKPVFDLPVTMTVEPTPSMGWVEGNITSLRTGEPLEATIIAEGQPYTVTSNPETGYYRFWLEEGLYNLQASAPGYVTQSVDVEITAQLGITQDISLLLDAPWMQVYPESLQSIQVPGAVTTQTLVITNAGPMSMEYEFIGIPTDTLRIVSDGSWRVSGTYVPGWETVGFDDSGWEYTVAPAPVNCDWEHCWDDPDIYTMWSEIQHQTIYIRKSFEIQDRSSVLSATITTRCDDDHDVYINGILVASDWDWGAGPDLITDITANLQTGLNVIAIMASDTVGGCRHMCVDTLIHLVDTTSDWLIVEPMTGTIPASTSTPIQITFDSITLQPDIYTTTLYLLSNDPLISMIEVPVTMTVETTPSMGWVEGIVTNLRTGRPLEATIMAEGMPYMVISDPETGYYRFWLEEGLYNLQASAPGYVTQALQVEIASQQGVTQDFTLLLDAPWLNISPENLSNTQVVGGVTTHTITISNTGTTLLNFNVNDGGLSEAVLLLHLNEPGGSNIFLDASGRGNDGSCTGDTCPMSGLPGHAGNAVLFDGVDDYIQASTNGFPTGNSDRTIAAWVKVNSVVAEEGLIAGYRNYGEWTQVYEIFIDQGDSRVLCFSQWGESVFGPSLELGEWYHVAVTNVGNLITLYLNGTPVGSGSLELNTPDGTQFYSGRAPGEWGNDRRLNGLVDELAVFDRALTDEEIMDLYHDTPHNDIPWLTVDPTSGTVGVNESDVVMVTFDATGMQPDVYTAILYILSNDPLSPVVEVPVTMTVTIPVTPTAVTINGPAEGFAGNPNTFTAVVEPDSASPPIYYLWQASDQEPITHTGGITDTVTFTWQLPGTRRIVVTASNEFGSVVDVHYIHIAEVPISDLVAYNDSPTLLGSPTTLSATITAGTNVTYAWDFGDQTSGSGAVATHTYTAVGVYTATVTARNAAGKVSAVTSVTISPAFQLYLPLVFKASAQAQGALPAQAPAVLAAALGSVAGGAGWWARRRKK